MIPYSQKDNVLGHLCCAKRYKLKQMEMAKRIGVDVSTFRQLKRRTIGLLSATKVNQISTCLREDINEKKNAFFFSEVEIQDLKISLELRILYILYDILHISNLKNS